MSAGERSGIIRDISTRVFAGEEPLKVRISRLLHSKKYRYSIPVLIGKLVVELAIWVGVVWIFATLLSLIGLLESPTLVGLPADTTLTVVAGATLLNRLFCKTTISEENL